MSDPTVRNVRVLAPGDALIQALAEHRPARDGWRIEPLDDAPPPDALVILDLERGDAQRKVVEELRNEGFEGPILIIGDVGSVSSPDTESIPRPVRLGTLLARLDAHRGHTSDIRQLGVGPYLFLFQEGLLKERDDDQYIRLTDFERKLFLYLLEAKGALVSREELLASVWGYSTGTDTHTVETHVWRLRQKIETEDPSTRFLVSEPGGYRLLIAEGESGG